MDIIYTSFSNAVNQLLSLAGGLCTNKIPDNLLFVKCYDEKARSLCSENLFIFYNNAIKSNNVYSFGDIIKDISVFQNKGISIEWVDLTLFYISNNAAFISVELYLNKETSNSGIKYHISIIRSTHNLPQEKFDINDFIKYQK